MMPILREKMGFDLATAGLLFAATRFPTLFNPLFGALGDKFNLKTYIGIAPIVTAIAISSLVFVDTPAAAFAILLVLGFSSAIYHIPAPILIRKLSGSRVGTGMSVFMGGGEAARSLGPLMFAAAVSIFGFGGAWIAGIFGVLCGAALLIWMKELWRKEEINVNNPIRGAIEMLKRRRKFFLPLGGVVFAKAVLVVPLTSYIPIFMKSENESFWFSVGALSILEAAGVVGASFSGAISDTIGKKKTLYAIYALAPILLVVFAVVEGPLVFLVLILIGVLIFAISPVLLAYVTVVEPERATAANGFFMTMNFLFGSFVAFIFGFAGDYLSLQILFVIAAVLALSAIPFIRIMEEKENLTNLGK